MIEEALALVDTLAQKSGFSLAEVPSFEKATAIPPSSYYYKSDYARLLVVAILEPSESALLQGVSAAQECVDFICIQEERKTGAVIDGYVLAVIPELPSAAVQSAARRIELDPVACRKHIAWPIEAETADLRWHRIHRLTCLGIPPSPKASGIPGSPTLDQATSALLDAVRAASSPRQAALSHAGDKNFGAENATS